MNSGDTDAMTPPIGRRRGIGLAGAALWLIAISAVIVIWSLAAVGAQWSTLVLIVAVVAATGHFELMPSLNLIIVGIHFLPLAWIFHVPRYYLTGLLFCAVPMITLFAIAPPPFDGHGR